MAGLDLPRQRVDGRVRLGNFRQVYEASGRTVGTLFAPDGSDMTQAHRSSPRVVVISENPETVDGLQSYFVGVGINAQSLRSLSATANLPERTTAVVLFPDGFGADDVIGSIRTLHRKRPSLLLLLVTQAPQRFSAALAANRNEPPVVVLPKPAFGWAIVDAIRLHAEAQSCRPGLV
jgi:hypothetical protein